jgi:hypothetical protein
MFLPETHKIVKLYHGAANAVSCDYISCKNAVDKVYFVIFHYSGGGDTDLVLGLKEATDVAAGTNAAVTATFPIWSDTDAGTSSDTLVRQTNAATYTIDTTAGTDYMVVLEWDPALHTAGYDCITVYDATTGGNGSNTITILAVFESKYQGASLPSAIID